VCKVSDVLSFKASTYKDGVPGFLFDNTGPPSTLKIISFLLQELLLDNP
jgi:hypothetical protein